LKIKLSININKPALIRNSRGGALPNILQLVKDCEALGAEGITVHPRPDERHITYADVPAIKEIATTEYNIEGYPSEKWLKLVFENQPTQATLVPDPPSALTSNAGWLVSKHFDFLSDTIAALKSKGIRTALFMENDNAEIEAAKKVGAERIELYTGPYADEYILDKEKAIAPYIKAANFAASIGLEINAGHDLNLDNLTYFKQNIPNLLEVSIGHALWCDAIYMGLEKTVQSYIDCLVDP